MASRLFSVNRRRPNIVDVYTPYVAGVDGYRLKKATNFDAVFAAFLTAPNTGYRDPSINPNVIESQPTTGTSVRIVFNPATYAITDTTSFWMQLARVVGGAEVLVGAPTLILPDSYLHGTGIVTIAGSAPGTVLQLDLPRRMEDFRITNKDGANNLLVGTEDGDPMMAIPAKMGVQTIGFRGAQGSLYVKGDGGSVAFTATFTLAFPR